MNLLENNTSPHELNKVHIGRLGTCPIHYQTGHDSNFLVHPHRIAAMFLSGDPFLYSITKPKRSRPRSTATHNRTLPSVLVSLTLSCTFRATALNSKPSFSTSLFEPLPYQRICIWHRTPVYYLSLTCPYASRTPECIALLPPTDRPKTQLLPTFPGFYASVPFPWPPSYHVCHCECAYCHPSCCSTASSCRVWLNRERVQRPVSIIPIASRR